MLCSVQYFAKQALNLNQHVSFGRLQKANDSSKRNWLEGDVSPRHSC